MVLFNSAEQHSECILCNGETKTGKMQGGSIASAAVLENVGCDAFAAMDRNFTNEILPETPAIENVDLTAQEGGRGKKCKRIVLRKAQRKSKNKNSKQKGGTSTTCESQPMDILQPYVALNPATLPLTAPLQALDAIDYSQVNPATTSAMSQPTGGFAIMNTNASMPAIPNMTTI